RHFAKRQITWFKREPDVIWVNKNEFSYDNEKIIAFLLETLREKEIIS
ncbi:MAG: tRNA (adenosine(37)-N6)-dimethylallyltransferase MiaA, partial [Lachnospiraceae bacterium]|nr:tRNA (adenosine(37)-N6)-dimethylallyltransferase MiaA [Lachnospiraceae bacterium]